MIVLIIVLFLFVDTDCIYNNSLNFERTEEQEEPANRKEFSDGKYIGKITIEKIDVDLPIIENASEENLKHSTCHIKYTCFPGEKGNCFVAAHRSWTYGKFFNRLDELEPGDSIAIETGYGKYNYKVNCIEVVKPNNTEVFFRDEYDLTLVTCTPLILATYRLLVFCSLSEREV